ncbi:MAG: SH3 domain-containing protein [Armatimonadota bacterium]
MRYQQAKITSHRLLPTLLAGCFLLSLLSSFAWAAKARPAWVIPETLTVRSGPKTDSKRIGSLSRGAKVYVTAFSNKWCWCSLPGGSKGWVAEWMLQFSADKGRQLAPAATPAKSVSTAKGTPPAWVNVTAANVRSGPGLGGDSYGTLNQGDKVYVLGRRGDWVKCKTPGGSGWVRGDLLEYSITAGRQLAAATGKSVVVAAQPSNRAKSLATTKAYVTEEKVTLRSGPGNRFNKKATLVKGQTLYVSAMKGMWRKATVHNGATGWVAAWLIKKDDSTPSTPSSSGPEVARTDHILTAWVTAEKANVHSRASSEAPTKFQLKQGTKVQVAAVAGHWCKVRHADDFGWVAGWLIKFVPPGHAITASEGGEKVEVNVGWVARPVVNLRTAPDADAESKGDAKLGTRLIIIGKKDDWYKVALEDGNIGWMASRLIDTRGERLARRRGDSGSGTTTLARATFATPHDFPSPTDAGSDGSTGSTGSSDTGNESSGGGMGDALVATARKYLGCAYVHGASRPGAFDCSGLTSYVHRVHGIDISRGSREQFRQGSPIAREDLQPGDVLFFENTYRAGISHVGMYMGSGKFIHAANRRGGVKITDLDSDYYARRYVGARRMY